MTAVLVEIRRYIRDDFPGWVGCVMTDASEYPQQGIIGCEVGSHGDVVVIDMTRP